MIRKRASFAPSNEMGGQTPAHCRCERMVCQPAAINRAIVAATDRHMAANISSPAVSVAVDSCAARRRRRGSGTVSGSTVHRSWPADRWSCRRAGGRRVGISLRIGVGVGLRIGRRLGDRRLGDLELRCLGLS